MTFNLIDIFLLLVVLLSVWAGWNRGFFVGVLDLVRWISSFLAALLCYQPLSRLIAPLTGWTETWNQPAAFILLIVAVSVIVQIIGVALLRKIPKRAHEHRANHVFGLLPGLASGLITAAILAALLFALPFSGALQESLRESAAANRLASTRA